MLKGKKIILGISGSIAAYKSITLLRLLIKAGAEVKVILTPNATEFVSPLVLSTLSKNPVGIELMQDGQWSNHVHLGSWADLMIIAPLSCNTLAKLAHGLCDNLLLATFLSARCPVIVAPAMDEEMWHHKMVQTNLDKIRKELNIEVLEVKNGELASGIFGMGRMTEPEEILNYIKEKYFRTKEFIGKKIMITCGPTKEKIDPVRFISNFSSGKMGLALAESFYQKGADVYLISGNESIKSAFQSLHIIYVESSQEMYEKCQEHYKEMDFLIMSAAVADYKPFQKEIQKIKKNNPEQDLKLVKTIDILAYLGEHKKNHQILIGFALETEKGLQHAQEKLTRKKLDYIILNEISDNNKCFQSEENEITLVDKEFNSTYFSKQSKKEIAHLLTTYFSNKLNQKS